MQNSSSRPLLRVALVILSLVTWVLVGCNGQWSFSDTWTFETTLGDSTERGVRPGATSTPRPAQGSSPSMRPLAQIDATAEIAPQPTPNLAQLSTVEQLQHVLVPPRDLRDLALRLNPAIDPDPASIPLVVNDHTPDYAVGDFLTFTVHNLDTAQNIDIRAELVHKTGVAYAWVETGRSFNRAGLIEGVDAFSANTYPALVDFFGSEWNPGVDNDPRLHILHSTQLGSGIAGYYSSSDQYSRLANARSNEKEMFYINLAIIPRGDRDAPDMLYYETVLAHEFQHMIHWYQDRNEETWVNEGLSEYAQEVAGYPPDNEFTNAFANRPQTQLNTWSENQGNNAPHYGASYLFIHYFAQRFGEEATRALVASPANGIAGFNEVLTQIGLPPPAQDGDDGYGFDGLFADWVVANYAEDPWALGCGTDNGCHGPEDARYGYLKLEQLAPALYAHHTEYPVDPPPADLPNYATHYILLENPSPGHASPADANAQDLTFYFLGEVDTVLAQAEWRTTEDGRARAWWSNRGDDSNPRLTRTFDLRDIAPGTSVVMLVRMWWDIEANYDFGYVVASTDGQKWDVLPGSFTTEDDPAAASFGPGYTGRSRDINDTDDGWVVEAIDLSAYAGQEVRVRFEYVTDDAVNAAGWFIDEIQIPVLDYAETFLETDGGWQSEGWLLTDNLLEQRWLVQVLYLEANRLVELERYTADAEGRIVVPIANLGGTRSAVIAISPTTPVTTVPAPYTYRIE